MKTKTGYIYLIDGLVMVNPEKEPKLEDFEKYSIVQTITDIDGYEKALAEWLAKNIPVVNAEKAGYPKRWFIYIDEFYEVKNGQKVEHIEGKITKIL